MSLLEKCDICGKSAEKVKFDIRPIKIQIPNHKKEMMNVYVTVGIEAASDTKKIIDYYSKVQMMRSMSNLFGEVNNEEFDAGEMPIEMNEDNLKQSMVASLKIPNPCICKKCTREMMKLVSSYGSFEKPENIVGDDFKMPKKDK